LQIASIHGGSLRNAIPRKCAQVIIFGLWWSFCFDMQQIVNEIKTELKRQSRN
jgi:hypothetical protein